MVEPVEYYVTLFDEARTFGGDGDTVLVVRGATVAEAVEALGGVDPDDVPPEDWDSDELMWSTYSLVPIDGGVLATEDTGYADPPNSALVALSQGGRAAAVVRDNIQAHSRFGCARDGQLLFDSSEYTFLEDRSKVPEELRSLFDLAWIDLEDDDDAGDDAADPTAVGLAMAEIITGIRLTPSEVTALESATASVVAVRTMKYASECDDENGLVEIPAV